MLIRAFITHKESELFSDCQDRFSINPDTKSIAVSDGMTQSIFQKYWAELLVDTYISNREWVPNLSSVRELSDIWYDRVRKIIEQKKEAGNTYIWRGERKLANGYSAGATFLGVRFTGNSWECDVLGDSCLVLLQNNRIVKIISSEDVETFDNYPDYYDSNPRKEGKGTLKTEKGCLNQGDSLLLVTDPFSDFLLKNRNEETFQAIISKIFDIYDHQHYEEVVTELRKEGMHNDDSTLIIVEYDGSDSFSIKSHDDIDKLIMEENYTQENNPILNDGNFSSNKNEDIYNNDCEKQSLSVISEKTTREIVLGNNIECMLRTYIIKEILCWKEKALKKEKNRAKLDLFVKDIMRMFKEPIS